MKPLISIIIPTFNRAQLIAQTLNSVLAQSYSNWECIIIDDESTDNTKAAIAFYLKDIRFQYYKKPRNKPKGANACRNYGLELSKGKWIKWFDSDDLMLPDLLEKQYNAIDNEDVCVCKIAKYDFEAGITLASNKIQSQCLIEDYITNKVAFYVSGPLWKRVFLEKQKFLFDETISNLDDWDFNLRMLYANPKIIFVEEALIQYRIHKDSLSHEIGKLNRNEIKSEFKAREKHLKLLNYNKLVDSFILKKYMIKRYRFLLREALVGKKNVKYYLLQKLLRMQFGNLNFKGIFKTLFGFTLFGIFNRGYKFLK